LNAVCDNGGRVTKFIFYEVRYDMNLIKFITDKDICGIEEISNTMPRKAVRAILINDTGQIALLYIGKFDLYTIPGGGVEGDENLEEALKREILEETGYKCEITNELGYIRESRAAHDFTQVSFYYMAKIIGERGLPQMSQDEIEQQIQVQWHTPLKALDIIVNEKPQTYQQKYIQCRDKTILEKLINYLRTE